MLAAAVSMPPHARVNYRCHAVWNADRSDLRLVWDDAEYEHPFHAFNAQPHGTDRAACKAAACVQRLWCTDSGAAGWYGNTAGVDVNNDRDLGLYAAWLGHENVTYSTTLAQTVEGVSLAYSNAFGPGTVAV